MGGTIARLVAQRHTVHLVDMTNGEPTPHGSIETRAKESAEAAKILGTSRTLVGFDQSRGRAQYRIAAQNGGDDSRASAEFLFVPYPIDAHPDHVAVTKIAEDAALRCEADKKQNPRRAVVSKTNHLLFLHAPADEFRADFLHRYHRPDRHKNGGDAGV